MSVFAYCLVVLFWISNVAAHPHFCDEVGCSNGVCVFPPLTPIPLCNCSAGFELNIIHLFECVDIDECAADNNICGQASRPDGSLIRTGECVNTHGDYYCRCISGYFPGLNFHRCIGRECSLSTPFPANNFFRLFFLGELF